MPAEYPFRLRESFLSPAEITFYQTLSVVLRDQLVDELLTIAPKVSLLELISVRRPNENVQHFSRLARKSVDFLLVHRPNLHPRLAIELEYPKQAHYRTDRFMDELFKAIRLPFLRVAVKDKYDGIVLAEQIGRTLAASPQQAQRIDEHYSPVCPRCGITMVLRFYRSGPSVGERYYGCLNFPECKEIVAVY